MKDAIAVIAVRTPLMSRAASIRIAGVTLLGLVLPLLLQAAEFKFTQIDYPNALATEVLGINDREDIVGVFADNDTAHGFVLRKGKFQALDPPGSILTFARAINLRNEIVGFYFDANFIQRGFYYYNGQFRTIVVPNSTENDATGINDLGVISGEYFDLNGIEHGYVLEGGIFKTIDVPQSLSTDIWNIANNGAFAGDYSDASTVHGFLSPKPGLFIRLDFPGAAATAARWISETTEVVGRWDDYSIPLDLACSTQCHGFLWAKGEFLSIDVPGANSTVALGINDAGRIVGRFIDATGGDHGFMAIRCSDSSCQ